MKKLFLFITMLFVFNACSCEKEQAKIVDEALIVEQITSADREYMYLTYGDNYRWYETCIVLNEFLDEECTGTVHAVSNVFQVINDMEDGADTFVVLCSHVKDTSSVEVVHGFWVEDFPLNTEAIEISFSEAFDKINEVNYPKPHSQQIVLRKQVGPNEINPQYIFGNHQWQLYVDATTGEVKDWNPAFPKEDQLCYTFTW